MERKQVFEGIKVVDLSWVAAGPRVATELAVHGATVVRVECHRRPDTLRLLPPFKDGKPGLDRSAFGATYNANKYGISLDLDTTQGQELVKKLVVWADIVCESMMPGVMNKWGLDYENLKKIKPDIIMYSTNMHGQYGHYCLHGGYGNIGASMSGFPHVVGWPDRDPAETFGAYTDHIAPWYLAAALVAALAYRRRTGKGVYLDQSMREAAITFLGPYILDYTINGRVANRMGNHDPHAVPHGAYRCRGSDRWCAIAVRTDAEWEGFCKAMSNPKWTNDPRFATFRARKENEDEFDRLVEEWTRDYSPGQVMAIMQANGVPAGVVETCEDLFSDPQLKHRRHFRVLTHKAIGPHAYHAPSYRLSKTPEHMWKPGPCLGEDNEYVFKEILGLSDEEIAQLLIDGGITTEMDAPAGF